MTGLSEAFQHELDVDRRLGELADQADILRHFKVCNQHRQIRGLALGFAQQAIRLVEVLPDSEERSVALRKLLEGRDAMTRAVL